MHVNINPASCVLVEMDWYVVIRQTLASLVHTAVLFEYWV